MFNPFQGLFSYLFIVPGLKSHKKHVILTLGYSNLTPRILQNEVFQEIEKLNFVLKDKSVLAKEMKEQSPLIRYN